MPNPIYTQINSHEKDFDTAKQMIKMKRIFTDNNKIILFFTLNRFRFV